MYVVKEPLITFTFADRMSPDGDIFTFRYPVHVMEKTANMELYVREDKYTKAIYPDIINYTKKIFIQFLNVDKDNIIFMDCITKKIYSCNMILIAHQIVWVMGYKYNIVNPDMTMEQMLDRFKIDMLFARDVPTLYDLKGLLLYHNKEYNVNVLDNNDSILIPRRLYNHHLVGWDETPLDMHNEIILDIESSSMFVGMDDDTTSQYINIKLNKLSDKLWVPSADNEVIVTTLSNIDNMDQYQRMLESISKEILTRNKL